MSQDRNPSMNHPAWRGIEQPKLPTVGDTFRRGNPEGGVVLVEVTEVYLDKDDGVITITLTPLPKVEYATKDEIKIRQTMRAVPEEEE